MEASSNNTALEQELIYLKSNIDDVFLITNGIIVCLMQCGFACLEAGAIRAKNTTNIILKNIMDIFISGFCYWLCGYALAYGSGNFFFGHSYFAGYNLPTSLLSHWFWQFVFAATAATIVSGAVAERCAFKAYVVYSAVITGFLYPVVSHWAWSKEGWLYQLGYVDFAGSGVVHLLGGTCSLIGAIYLGPRHKRFQDGEIPGHSTPLTGLGAMILITGFLSFNGGSQGSMSNVGDTVFIGRAVTNTIMGGSGGSLAALIIKKMTGDKAWSFAITINGALAGMVSVCAGANEMDLWAGFVSGLFAALVYMSLRHIALRLKIDDPLDAFAVHFGGGLWGLFSAAIFANNGLIMMNFSEASLLGLLYRVIGAVAIFTWSAVGSGIMFGILSYLGMLRVSLEDEIRGLDISIHKEPAYTNEVINKETSNQQFQQYRNVAYIDTEASNQR